jgi:hypothetical protein
MAWLFAGGVIRALQFKQLYETMVLSLRDVNARARSTFKAFAEPAIVAVAENVCAQKLPRG